ncbi:MAG: DUF1015 family protein [Bacteroidia bacterium]|nr:DUF1015 family protein [Bacteroidia bacterium]
MAIIKTFRGLRPLPALAAAVASRPYDVINTEEARAEAEGNPHSFLHVVKPEIDLPADTHPYAPVVYETGRDNFQQLVAQGAFVRDSQDSLYIYRLEMDGQAQSGIVAAAAVADYLNEVIRKHELTRPDKEEDRKNHVRISRINAEPVFFAYPAQPELDLLVAGVEAGIPVYDFTAVDGIRHTLWVVDDPAVCAEIVRIFAEKIPFTYVADGHHRTAAAARVGQELREANPDHTGNEEYNYFLAVHFPDNQLRILDYNRVVRDLNGHTPESLLAAIGEQMEVIPQADVFRPSRPHTFGMYLTGKWYELQARPGTFDPQDPIGVLDVTILGRQILEPILGIGDQRTDKRIDFVGGMRGLGELARRVDSGEMQVAFSMYPVSMKQLMNIADGGFIMPPKVTWFEPKLRSGLVVYSL